MAERTPEESLFIQYPGLVLIQDLFTRSRQTLTIQERDDIIDTIDAISEANESGTIYREALRKMLYEIFDAISQPEEDVISVAQEENIPLAHKMAQLQIEYLSSVLGSHGEDSKYEVSVFITNMIKGLGQLALEYMVRNPQRRQSEVHPDLAEQDLPMLLTICHLLSEAASRTHEPELVPGCYLTTAHIARFAHDVTDDREQRRQLAELSADNASRILNGYDFDPQDPESLAVIIDAIVTYCKATRRLTPNQPTYKGNLIPVDLLTGRMVMLSYIVEKWIPLLERHLLSNDSAEKYPPNKIHEQDWYRMGQVHSSIASFMRMLGRQFAEGHQYYDEAESMYCQAYTNMMQAMGYLHRAIAHTEPPRVGDNTRYYPDAAIILEDLLDCVRMHRDSGGNGQALLEHFSQMPDLQLIADHPAFRTHGEDNGNLLRYTWDKVAFVVLERVIQLNRAYLREYSQLDNNWMLHNPRRVEQAYSCFIRALRAELRTAQIYPHLDQYIVKRLASKAQQMIKEAFDQPKNGWFQLGFWDENRDIYSIGVPYTPDNATDGKAFILRAWKEFVQAMHEKGLSVPTQSIE